MTGRRLLQLVGMLVLSFAAVPASASALCNGMAATVGGATSSNDTLTGTSGNDVIEGLGGNDTINGGGGNDTICGDDGDDTINGEGGDDHLEGGTTGETLGDTVTFLGTANGINADLSSGVATTFPLETDSMTGFENLTGSNSFDDLRGDGGANVIDGLNAADLFQGRGGNDTLSDTGIGVSDQDTASYADATGGVTGSLVTNQVSGPGVGTDTLSGILGLDGSNFADTLIGNDADNGLGTVLNLLNGSAGDDTLEPRGGTDRLNGGADSDVVSYANDAAVTINLAAGTAVTGTTTDELSAIENAVGSPNNDTLTGSTGDNVLDGFGGDDHLDGGGGIDTASFASQPLGVDASLVTNTAFGQGSDTLANFENLTGSEQHDLLIGDGAANAFDGGPEEDTVAFTGLSQGVSASLVTNSATGQGSDTLTGIENLTGSDQDDTLTGDAGPNVLSGRDGADNLTGGLGADGFFLGDGLDVITADDGVVDAIDCEGTGPDSGSVDGPAPAETYNDCDSDGDSVVDFLDSCPTTSGAGADGCVPPVVTPPTQTTPTTPQAPAATTKKKCKKKKKHLAASVAKKKCKKKKR